MKQLLLALSVLFLLSCSENENYHSRSLQTFSIAVGDSINNEENLFYINVSGVSSPYTIDQINNIEFSVYHTHMEEISISLISPQGAQFFATDLSDSVSNMVDRVILPDDEPIYVSMNETYYNYGTPVELNGTWMVYVGNVGTNHGYLSEFSITFNY